MNIIGDEFIDLERVEFITTYKCNSVCKHCLIQPQLHQNEILDPTIASELLMKLFEHYPLLSISTFGGEPILALETTLKLHDTAQKLHIPHRQLQTNGIWLSQGELIKLQNSHPMLFDLNFIKFQRFEFIQARIPNNIQDVYRKIGNQLAKSGVNDVNISCDAFHQEFLSLDLAIFAAHCLKKAGVQKIVFTPRWIRSNTFNHKYNDLTHRIMKIVKNLGFQVSEGEEVQPRGNALINFADCFIPIDPSPLNFSNLKCDISRLTNVNSICISPNREVIICNNIILGQAFPDTIQEILKNYNPLKFRDLALILDGNIERFDQEFTKRGIPKPEEPFYSICDLCFKYRKKLGYSDTCNA